jgi:hypothetical protein
MMIYPPFLDQILDRCPKAALTYTRLWRSKDQDNVLHLDKEYTNSEYCGWKTFKNHLQLLKKEKVIRFTINILNNKATVILIMPSQDSEKAA